jgi:hypothetical protein
MVNISIGETGPLEIAVRNPVSENFVLSRPYYGDIPLRAVKQGDEYFLSLPELEAWKTATVRAL